MSTCSPAAAILEDSTWHGERLAMPAIVRRHINPQRSTILTITREYWMHCVETTLRWISDLHRCETRTYRYESQSESAKSFRLRAIFARPDDKRIDVWYSRVRLSHHTEGSEFSATHRGVLVRRTKARDFIDLCLITMVCLRPLLRR